MIYNGKGWRILVFGFKSQSLCGISSLKRLFWGEDLYTSFIQFPCFQNIQNLGQGTGGMLQSLEVNYCNLSLLSLDPNRLPAQSPLKLGTGLSTCWFLTPSHTLGRSPPRWKHRCSSSWKIILRLISQISLRFRKAHSMLFQLTATLGLYCCSLWIWERMLEQIMWFRSFYRLVELKPIADGFQISLPFQTCFHVFHPESTY